MLVNTYTAVHCAFMLFHSS